MPLNPQHNQSDAGVRPGEKRLKTAIKAANISS